MRVQVLGIGTHHSGHDLRRVRCSSHQCNYYVKTDEEPLRYWSVFVTSVYVKTDEEPLRYLQGAVACAKYAVKGTATLEPSPLVPTTDAPAFLSNVSPSPAARNKCASNRARNAR